MAHNTRLYSLDHLSAAYAAELLLRIYKRCEPRGACLEWQGAKRTDQGYGAVKVQGKLEITHRVVYMLVVGDIPEGFEVDHTCDNNKCLFEDHLEPKSHWDNSRRGNCAPAVNARKTHCHKGHPLSGDNLLVMQKGRVCRICRNDYQAAWRRANPRNHSRENSYRRKRPDSDRLTIARQRVSNSPPNSNTGCASKKLTRV